MTNILALVDNCSQGSGPSCLTSFPEVTAGKSQFQDVLAIVFGVLAAVAIITMILAAINMASAGGDTERISRAKKSVIYSLVGLVIALSAEVIVLTLLGRL